MSKVHVESHDAQRKVGDCPSCKYPLFAEIRLTTELSLPRWPDTLPQPAATASVKVSGMSLHHECGELVTEDWLAPFSTRHQVGPEVGTR